MNEKNAKPASIAAQALGWIDGETRGIVAPIHASTTYIRDPDNQYRTGRIYASSDRPDTLKSGRPRVPDREVQAAELYELVNNLAEARLAIYRPMILQIPNALAAHQ